MFEQNKHLMHDMFIKDNGLYRDCCRNIFSRTGEIQPAILEKYCNEEIALDY